MTDINGRSIRLFFTAGQVRDYAGAAGLINDLPRAERLLADRGADADWFREALLDKGTRPYNSRKNTVTYDKRRYILRDRIEKI